MNRLSAILPAPQVLVSVEATSKKRAFEEAGLLFETLHGLNRALITDSLFAREDNLEIDAYLLANRGSNGFLLTTRPQFEYLLLLRGENAPAIAAEWKDDLKKQAWWDLCYPLEKERHSSLAHVLYL